jgi:hypothetical protein
VRTGSPAHRLRLLVAAGRAVHTRTPQRPQHLYLDKADDNPTGEEAVAAHSYVPHIRRIGEE